MLNKYINTAMPVKKAKMNDTEARANRKPQTSRKRTIALSMLAGSTAAVLISLAAYRGFKLTKDAEVPVSVVRAAEQIASTRSDVLGSLYSPPAAHRSAKVGVSMAALAPVAKAYARNAATPAKTVYRGYERGYDRATKALDAYRARLKDLIPDDGKIMIDRFRRGQQRGRLLTNKIDRFFEQTWASLQGAPYLVPT